LWMKSWFSPQPSFEAQAFRYILGKWNEFKTLILVGSPLSARRKTITSLSSHNSSFHDFLSWILQRIICKDLYGALRFNQI
jgi:hypothetical protein